MVKGIVTGTGGPASKSSTWLLTTGDRRASAAHHDLYRTPAPLILHADSMSCDGVPPESVPIASSDFRVAQSALPRLHH